MRFRKKGVRPAFQFFLVMLIFLSSSCEEISHKLNNTDYSLNSLFNLPEVLAESSGCIAFDSLIWTINDRGNSPEMYGVSLLTGEISRTIRVINTENIDWEDIAQDNSKIYIGDFGNNGGDRKDLAIYIIDKSSISSDELQLIYPQKISFLYSDQDNYELAHNANSFDCGAMFVLDDTIFLMTKDWLHETSTVYKLPALPGEYTAVNSETISTDGLVTGADFDEESRRVIICGYKNYLPFVWIYGMSSSNRISTVGAKRFDFSDKFGYQFDGVTFFNHNFLLTNEYSVLANQAAWKLTLPGEDR